MSDNLSPLTNLKRFSEAKRQLEEIESGVSTADKDGFESMAIAFFEVSKMKHGESQDYFDDMQWVDGLRKIFMLSQYKQKPRKNNATRRTNLAKAIIAALDSLGKKPSLDELWDFFEKDKDKTGHIHDTTDICITWMTTTGNFKDSTKKTVGNMLSRLNNPK